MKFEHLVEVNDLSIAGIVPLTRAQLWQGLVIRAELPRLTLIGLDECEILERGENFIRREQRFGDLRIRDRVSFLPMQSVSYQTEQNGELPAARLTMAIEEPAPGHLYLRFTYVVAETARSIDGLYAAHLKQAYSEADIDTVATIRRLLSEGLLAGEDGH